MTVTEQELFDRLAVPLTKAVAEALHAALLEYADRAATGPALALLILTALHGVAAGALGGLQRQGQLGWTNAEIVGHSSHILTLALETWAKEQHPRGTH